jgi:pimeloyl-ACP methyl ester carboxylesterase
MRVKTARGRVVQVDSTGSGPGVVVVHGAVVTGADYARLAKVLGRGLTVHRYNRHADPYTGYDLDDDIDLLAQVMEETGSRRVLGHSFGGFVALRAALRVPMERLAVYEAAISIDGSLLRWAGDEFLAAFEHTVSTGDFPLASAQLSHMLAVSPPLSRLPVPVLARVLRVLARLPSTGAALKRLPSVVEEVKYGVGLDAPASAYAGIKQPVQLAVGGRSPEYFHTAARALATALPNAHEVVLTRGSHETVMRPSASFLSPIATFLRD